MILMILLVSYNLFESSGMSQMIDISGKIFENTFPIKVLKKSRFQGNYTRVACSTK